MDLVKKVVHYFCLTLQLVFYFLSFQEYDNDDLQQFKRSLLSGCDINRDKKISKPELKMVLLALSQAPDS